MGSEQVWPTILSGGPAKWRSPSPLRVPARWTLIRIGGTPGFAIQMVDGAPTSVLEIGPFLGRPDLVVDQHRCWAVLMYCEDEPTWQNAILEHLREAQLPRATTNWRRIGARPRRDRGLPGESRAFRELSEAIMYLDAATVMFDQDAQTTWFLHTDEGWHLYVGCILSGGPDDNASDRINAIGSHCWETLLGRTRL